MADRPVTTFIEASALVSRLIAEARARVEAAVTAGGVMELDKSVMSSDYVNARWPTPYSMTNQTNLNFLFKMKEDDK